MSSEAIRPSTLDGIKRLAKAIKGEKLEKVIDTGYVWYDKTNMADPAVAAVLYD